MSKSEREIMSSRDARDWADYFVKAVSENLPEFYEHCNKESIHSTMLTWFAAAMMAMHDSIHNNEIKELKNKIKQLNDLFGKEDYYTDHEYDDGNYVPTTVQREGFKLMSQIMNDVFGIKDE